MPYSALPQVVPFRPFSSFISGVGAADQLQTSHLRREALQEELGQARRRNEALEEFKASGDPQSLIPALTPQQAMMAKGGMQLQKLQIANAASQYFTSIQPYLTHQSYPQFRQDAIGKFGDLARQHFPDPGEFKSDQDFRDWKMSKETMIAQMKAMQKMMTPTKMRPGDQMTIPLTGQILGERAPQYKPTYDLLQGPNGPYYALKGGPVRAGTTGKAGVPAKPGWSLAKYNEYMEGKKAGKWKDPIDYERQLAEAKQRGKEAGISPAKKRKIEAQTKVAEAKAKKVGLSSDIMEKLYTELDKSKEGRPARTVGPKSPGTPPKKPKKYRDRVTGETLTEEEFEQKLKESVGAQ